MGSATQGQQQQQQQAPGMPSQQSTPSLSDVNEGLGWFSRAWNFITDNFFTIVITGGAAWFFTQTEQGKELWGQIKGFLSELFEKIIGMLPESWQLPIKAFLGKFLDLDMKQEVLSMDLEKFQTEFAEAAKLDVAEFKKLVPNEAARKELVELIANANGGKFKLDDMTNDKTIFALITQKPELVEAVAKANMKPGQDGKLSDNAQKIIASLKTIAGDERLDALLTTHRDKTSGLLKAIGVELTEKQKALIESGVVANKALPELRSLVGAMLTLDANGKPPTMESLAPQFFALAKATPGAAVAALEVMKEREPKLAALMENNGGKAFAALQQKLGSQQQALDFAQQFYTRDKTKQMQFALANRETIQAYLSTAKEDALPAEFRAAIAQLRSVPRGSEELFSRVIGKPGVDVDALRALAPKDSKAPFDAKTIVNELLTNPTQRASLTALGAEDAVAVAQAYAKNAGTTLPASITKVNVDAVMQAVNEIGGSLQQKMADAELNNLKPQERAQYHANIAAREETIAVVNALVDKLVSDKNEGIAALKPTQIAHFFANTTTNEATRQLLINTKKGMSAKQKDIAQTLLNHWTAVTALATDENGVALVKEKLMELGRTPQAANCRTPGELDFMDGIKLWMAEKSGSELGKNAEEIKALKKDLDVASCTGVAPNPLPTAGRGYSPMRPTAAH